MYIKHVHLVDTHILTHSHTYKHGKQEAGMTQLSFNEVWHVLHDNIINEVKRPIRKQMSTCTCMKEKNLVNTHILAITPRKNNL